MAFAKAGLKADLEAFFTTLPATYHDSAAAFAAAYRAYAQGGTSCQGVTATTLAAAESVLSAALEAAFQASTNPATTAASLAAAFTAFWLTPPVAFAGTTPGLVSAVVGTAVLQAALPTMWAANVASVASASDAAQAHADALDLFSKTVVVTHAPPSACAAPLA